MEQPVDVEVADVFLQSALDDLLLIDADALLCVEDGQLAPRQDLFPLEASVEAEPVPLLTSTQVLGQLRILEDILQPVDELPPLQPAGELPLLQPVGELPLLQPDEAAPLRPALPSTSNQVSDHKEHQYKNRVVILIILIIW